MNQRGGVTDPLMEWDGVAVVSEMTPRSRCQRMKVLVAGDRGYIGAVMHPFLRAAGHQVDGLDLGLYEGCDLGPAPEEALRRPQDMRDVRAGPLVGYDA